MKEIQKTKWIGPFMSKEEAKAAVMRELPPNTESVEFKYKRFEYDKCGTSNEYYCKAKYVKNLLSTDRGFKVVEAGHGICGCTDRFTREAAEQAAMLKVPTGGNVFKVTFEDLAPHSPIREYWQVRIYYTLHDE